MIVGPHSTKLPQSRDTESDQLGVPAITFEHAVQFDRFDSWWLRVFLPFFCRRQLPRVRELQTEGNYVQQFK